MNLASLYSMTRIALCTLALFGAAAPALAAPMAAQSERSTADRNEIELYVGQTLVLNEAKIKRIAVGNGNVVSASALDDRQILLLPEKPGQSTVHLWRQNGQERTLIVTVVAADSQRLLKEVRTMIGSIRGVQASLVGDKVVLTGGDLNAESAARLKEVVTRYQGQVVNLVSTMGLERMIYMDVKIMEFNKKALEDLGVNWQKTLNGPLFGIIGDWKNNRYFRLVSDGQPNGSFGPIPRTPARSSRSRPTSACRPRPARSSTCWSARATPTCWPSRGCPAAAAATPTSWPAARSRSRWSTATARCR
ncbi:pilus assembly protein N-terminal domain-containing protein [Chitinimonas koreensis]|uniref:pilus assembly protein N-terminal domain-containing protein n=1 Tax=Chitinimonas koreensis TaxID=356302 RepID=UPI00165496F2|nr:pilus assembly protein N-terminal domain-containing protein [Chitinimonas koreensis]QNM97792.1 pilus assembly protein N-terminal domain-containing protein [Chitinimonas koreensis]